MDRANPYNYNLPVDPQMFFGRQADAANLVNDLTAVPGDSIALIGGRRMGKTSMLEAVRRGLESRRHVSPRAQRFCGLGKWTWRGRLVGV
jgi:hypothetical protein